MMLRLLTTVFFLLAGTAPAFAAQVNVPIRLNHDFIRQAIATQLFAVDGKAKLWDDGEGCGFLTLWDPQVDSAGGRIRITSQGEAQIGTPVGSTCLAPIQWKGFIEVYEAPFLSEDRQVLQFRVVESNLLDRKRQKSSLTSHLWDVIKEHVHPRFEAVRFDLHSAMQDLRELLPLVIVNVDAPRIEEMLSSIRLLDAFVTPAGVTTVISFVAQPSSAPAAATPEPTLTQQEIDRWQAAWQRWDGFLTFVVKIFGKDIPAREVQLALRDIVVEARYDIIAALAPQPDVPDPTRALFLKTWERLAPVVRASAASLPGSTGLRYLSFVAAGDALAALDQAGPDIGLDISADGLRRMARVLSPYTTDDPLAYSLDVDPELRQLFGFGAPLPAPDLSAMPDDAPDGALIEEVLEEPPTPAATADNPSTTAAQTPAPADAQTSPTPAPQLTPTEDMKEEWLRPSVWLELLLRPRRVLAATAPPTGAALERWIAEPANLTAYLQGVREILLEASRKNLARGKLAPKYHDLYRKLVLATAWKESCWRQFLRSKGRVTYIKSSVGATGMMQVFEKVWRGVYDVNGLRWDIGYNTQAGAEILLHYLNDYAIAKKEDQQNGGVDNLARATYAVYNGGPGHLSRYRRKETKRSLRQIDDMFYEKYLVVSAGRELEVSKCFGGT